MDKKKISGKKDSLWYWVPAIVVISFALGWQLYYGGLLKFYLYWNGYIAAALALGTSLAGYFLAIKPCCLLAEEFIYGIEMRRGGASTFTFLLYILFYFFRFASASALFFWLLGEYFHVAESLIPLLSS
jgi:hypothetical protein